MQETGIVTGLDGEFALVRVTRIAANGCGCGVTTAKQDDEVKARNLCNAEAGDTVRLETAYDRDYFRSSIRTAACVPGFVAGALIGEALLPALGVARSMPLSAGLGAVAAAAAFFIAKRFFDKKPLRGAAAYEVVSPYR
jgi:hypothetical protein